MGDLITPFAPERKLKQYNRYPNHARLRDMKYLSLLTLAAPIFGLCVDLPRSEAASPLPTDEDLTKFVETLPDRYRQHLINTGQNQASGQWPFVKTKGQATAGLRKSSVEIQILGSAQSPRSLAKQITIIREEGGRIDWSPRGNRIAVDLKGSDRFYDIYLITPDGGNEKCITCDTVGVLSNGHNGQPAWHPTSRYIAFQSQKRETTRSWGKNIAAQPGFGRYSDLWVADLQTKQFTQLTFTADTKDTGVLHPHFSKDGKQLTWSEMYMEPNARKRSAQAGYWKIKIGDFSVRNGKPELGNIRAFEPGGPGFYENHGLSPDSKKFLFTGGFEGIRNFFKATSIYHFDYRTNSLKKLASEKYNEHAHYRPGTNRIFWMTSRENPTRGTDYWSMNLDGSGKRRVTDFNNPKLATYRKKLVVAADASFSPEGTKLAAYLQTNLLTQEGPLVIIDLE